MKRGSDPSNRNASRPRMPASRFQPAALERAAMMMPATAAATTGCDGFGPICGGLFGSLMLKSQAPTPMTSAATVRIKPMRFMVVYPRSEVEVNGDEHAATRREWRYVDVLGNRMVPVLRSRRIVYSNITQSV